MGEILAIVLPVFGLIGLGAAIAWTKLLSHASGDALSEFVFVVAIPLLIFRIVATADLAGISAWRLWLAFFAAFARELGGRHDADPPPLRPRRARRARRRPRRGLRQHDADRHPAGARRLRRGRVGADGAHHRRAAPDHDGRGGGPDGARRAAGRRRIGRARGRERRAIGRRKPRRKPDHHRPRRRDCSGGSRASRCPASPPTSSTVSPTWRARWRSSRWA